MNHRRYAIWWHQLLGRTLYLPLRLTLLSVAVMGMIGASSIYLLTQAWSQVSQEHERKATAAGLEVANRVSQAINAVNSRIEIIASFTALQPGDDAPLQPILARTLQSAGSEIGGFLVLNDRNKIVAAAGGSFAPDHDPSGQAALTAAGQGFGNPITAGGEQWLPVSHPVARADGRGYMVVAMLRMSFFRKLLIDGARGPGDMLGMFEIQGPLLAHWPDPPAGTDMRVAGQKLTDLLGNAVTATTVVGMDMDHVARALVVVRVAGTPFGVLVGFRELAMLRDWLPAAAGITLIGGLLLAMMMAFYVSLGAELKRRRDAEALIVAGVARFEQIAAQYRLLAEYSSDVIIQIDFDGFCRYVSPAIEDMLGWTGADLIGKHVRFMIHPEDEELLREEVEFLKVRCGPIRSHFRAHHRDGSYLWIESAMQLVTVDGKVDSFVANMRDISERIETERRLAEAASEMAQLAATDQLTGLANRRRFNQELAREWRRAAREELALSVMLLDVDFFKIYNDTYGHQGGDDVLQAVARAIMAALHRSADLPARWGGEEFVVLLPGTDLAGVIAVAERLRAAIEALQIPHSGSQCGFLTVSIGVATGYPGRNQSPDPLIAEADANLYEAKHRGRNRVGAPPVEPLLWVGM